LKERVGSPDVLALAAAAVDDHARHALQRVGHVLVGEFTDIFGRHDVDDGVGLAFLVEALLDRIAVAGHHHLFRLLRICLRFSRSLGRHGLGLRGGHAQQGQGDRRGDRGGAQARALA
jgi:hypothetical protein